jgi:hypothetical protein
LTILAVLGVVFCYEIWWWDSWIYPARRSGGGLGLLNARLRLIVSGAVDAQRQTESFS